MILEYLSHINFLYVLYWIVGQASLLFVCYWLWKTKNRLSRYIIPILIVVILRLCLFENVVSWSFYYKILSWEEIGFRQRATFNHEIKRFLRRIPEDTKYLAVGTSQTGAVFRKYSKTRDDFRKFELPGMGPLDMYLYRNYIMSYHPECIILYLSEFDLARIPDLNLAKIAPNQRTEMFKLWPDLYYLSQKYENHIALKEMVFGEFFPEYKYSFIFKGIIDKIADKKGLTFDRNKIKSSDNEILMEHVHGLIGKLNESEIEINFKFLKKFLSFCLMQETRVVILEGQYNPLAYNSKTLGLNAIIKRRLKAISENDKNVSFIPRSQTVTFLAADYSDAYHPSGETVDRYVQNAMKSIEKLMKNKENNL